MSYKVAIKSKKVVFETADGESILDGAMRDGIDFPHGCRNGQCGACKVKVTKGDWRYLDGYSPDILSRSEIDQDFVVSCKAAPTQDLMIELNNLSVKSYQRRLLLTTVESVEPLTPDVACLALRLPKGEIFPYHPGQYVDFLLEDDQRRSFSLATRPTENSVLEFHIRRVNGGLFSERLFTNLEPGDQIRIEGPLGSFRFDEHSSRPVIFIAGGTGFAPIKSILENTLHQKKGNPACWLYRGVRNAESLYLDGLAREWSEQYKYFHYEPVASKPDKEWRGRRGPVHAAVVRDHPDLSGFDIYMAGPPAMIDAARDVLSAYGLPDDRLFCDAFHSNVYPQQKTKGFLRTCFPFFSKAGAN